MPHDTVLKKLARLCRNAVADLDVELSGLNVLTEVGSGNFVVTPIIAALAGADKVYAVTRDSSYGAAEEVMDYGRKMADLCGVSEQIVFSDARPHHFAPEADVVTNLGFVRPLDRELIGRLKKTAAISLMWEPWEFRPEDLDIEACKFAQVPVVATCETDSRLRTFEYVGLLAVKLLLERSVEILGSRILVVGSAPFGRAVTDKLEALGASVVLIESVSSSNGQVASSYNDMDAVVVVEHRSDETVIGAHAMLHPDQLVSTCTEVVHICGVLDYKAIEAAGLFVYPQKQVSHGYMTVTTDYVGARPVTYLHAAGLKVGGIVARARQQGRTCEAAVQQAIDTGLGLALA